MSYNVEYRKTCKRLNIEYHAHYLTFSCFQRRPFLSGKQSPHWLADAIRDAKQKTPFDLWAYVFMPTHAHLLLFPHVGLEVSDILWWVKKPVTDKAIVWVREHKPAFLERMAHRQPNGKCSHRFWQRGGGYDRNIRSAEEAHEKRRYIHNNPVVKGLCQNPEDWPWSSCRTWLTGVDEPLAIDRDSFPLLYKL